MMTSVKNLALIKSSTYLSEKWKKKKPKTIKTRTMRMIKKPENVYKCQKYSLIFSSYKTCFELEQLHTLLHLISSPPITDCWQSRLPGQHWPSTSYPRTLQWTHYKRWGSKRWPSPQKWFYTGFVVSVESNSIKTTELTRQRAQKQNLRGGSGGNYVSRPHKSNGRRGEFFLNHLPFAKTFLNL